MIRAARVATIAKPAIVSLLLFLACLAAFTGLGGASQYVSHDAVKNNTVPPPERWNIAFEQCQFSASALAGTREREKKFFREAFTRSMVGGHGPHPCDNLWAYLDGEDVKYGGLKTRYLWGANHLYAISVSVVRDDILSSVLRWSTVAAGSGLALLLLLSGRRFWPVAPLPLCAVFASSLQRIVQFPSGLPFLWPFIFAAALVLTVKYRPSWSVYVCVVAGAISAYLWLLDGHQALALALSLAIGYFGTDRGWWRRLRTAIWFSAVYVGSFTASFFSGMLLKGLVLSAYGVSSVGKVLGNVVNSTEARGNRLVDGLGENLIVDNARMWLADNPYGEYVLLLVAGAALAVVAHFVASGQRRQLADVAFLALIGVACVHQFILTDDIPFQSARYVFIYSGIALGVVMLGVQSLLAARD